MNAQSLPQPGDVIAGKYLVKGVIGQGGVGVVVAADHQTLRCPVAIKFLRPGLAYSPELVRRFLREARAAARLRSEHVARVMDADSTDDGAAFLVMELLDGRDLAAILKEGPLPIPLAVDYLMQACEAVSEAHSLGIVHRDLKPANMFLAHRPDGTALVKVLDFGLSKVDRSPSQATLTEDHHVIGSPHFMSPEQMRSSHEADARSDIWSLGVVLYSFVAGRVPFEGTYLTEVCAAVLSGSAQALASLRPDVPPGLAAVVERCLRLEPEERFQNVGELVAGLAPFRTAGGAVLEGAGAAVLATTPGGAETPRRGRGRPRGMIALGAVVVAVAAIGLLAWPKRAPDLAPAPVANAAEAAATATALPPSPPPSLVVTASPVESTPVRSPAPRRASGGPPRRTSPHPAPAAAAVSATGPRAAPRAARSTTDEDVILGLPH